MQPPTQPKRDPLLNIFLIHKERRLRSGWRLIGQIIILILVSISISLPLYFVGLIFPNIDSISGGYFISFLVVTSAVYLARRLLDRRSFTSLGLVRDLQAAKDFTAGLIITAVMMGFIFFTMLLFGWLQFEGFSWSQKPIAEIINEVGFWAIAFLFVGWYEELQSRGYQLQNLAEGIGMLPAVFLSSLIFAIAHLGNPNASFVATTTGILAAGIFLAYGYLRTRQLWLSIGLHVGWNFFEGPIFGFPVSGIETSPLLLHTSQGSELITGGEFGPEAGLILLPAIGLGMILVYSYTRKHKPQFNNLEPS